MTQLKPCPFCGISDVGIFHEDHNGTAWWFVQCENCTAVGPQDLGISGAEEQWNTRPLEEAAEARAAALLEVSEKVYIWMISYGVSGPMIDEFAAAIAQAKGEEG